MDIDDLTHEYNHLLSLNIAGDSYKSPIVSDPEYKKHFDEIKNYSFLNNEFDMIENLIRQETKSMFIKFDEIRSESSILFLFITYDFNFNNKNDYKHISSRIFNVFSNISEKYSRTNQTPKNYEILSELLQKYFVFGVIIDSIIDPYGNGCRSATKYKNFLLKNDLVLTYFDAFKDSGSKIMNEYGPRIEKTYEMLKQLFSEKVQETKFQQQSKFKEEKIPPHAKTHTPKFKEKKPSVGKGTNCIHKSYDMETINIINDNCFYLEGVWLGKEDYHVELKNYGK